MKLKKPKRKTPLPETPAAPPSAPSLPTAAIAQTIPLSSPESIQRALNAVVLQAQAAGIPSFLFGFPQGDREMTVRFENLGIRDASRIAIFTLTQALTQTIDYELLQNKSLTPARRQALTDLKNCFLLLIKKTNERIAGAPPLPSQL